MRTLISNALSCRAAPDPGAGGGASPAEVTTADEALKAEDARYAAQTGLDFFAMERLFADDLVYLHSNGVIDDKAGYIESQRSSAVIYRSMQRSDVKVRVFGPVAILTRRAKFEVRVNGDERTANLLFHSIWTKRGAHLQFVSFQALPAPD